MYILDTIACFLYNVECPGMLSQREDFPSVGFTRPTRIESRGWAFIQNPFLCAIFPLQVDTDVMYLLSPNGSIVRSKARLKKEFEQLGVSESDLRFPLRLSTYTIDWQLCFQQEAFGI